MFSKLAIFTVAVAAVAYAAPYETKNSCNVGEVQCCNSLQAANADNAQALAGVLQVAVGSVTGLIGANCSPLSVIGIAGNSCNATPVCCENNNFNGVVALGCTPVNVNL